MGLGEDIRWVFGSFLFSLVVIELTSKTARLLLRWKLISPAIRTNLAGHLIVTFVIVIGSWIGWSLSIRSGGYPAPARVFDVPTITLLVDLLLLIWYYCLTMLVDSEEDYPVPVEVEKLSRYVCWIFLGYLCWDMTTSVEVSRPFGAREGITAIAFLLSILLYFAIRRVPPASVLATGMAHTAILFLVLAFRCTKDLAASAGAAPWLAYMAVGCLISSMTLSIFSWSEGSA